MSYLKDYILPLGDGLLVVPHDIWHNRDKYKEEYKEESTPREEESDGIKTIRQNIRDYGKRQSVTDKHRKANNRSANPKKGK
jgi:hypothetical protein